MPAFPMPCRPPRWALASALAAILAGAGSPVAQARITLFLEAPVRALPAGSTYTFIPAITGTRERGHLTWELLENGNRVALMGPNFSTEPALSISPALGQALFHAPMGDAPRVFRVWVTSRLEPDASAEVTVQVERKGPPPPWPRLVQPGLEALGPAEEPAIPQDSRGKPGLCLGTGVVAIHPQGGIVAVDDREHCVLWIRQETVTVIAGTGEAGFDGDLDPEGREWPATQARIDTPTGVVVTPEGEVVCSDTWNSRIRMITRRGALVTVAGVPDAKGFATAILLVLVPGRRASASDRFGYVIRVPAKGTTNLVACRDSDLRIARSAAFWSLQRPMGELLAGAGEGLPANRTYLVLLRSKGAAVACHVEEEPVGTRQVVPEFRFTGRQWDSVFLERTFRGILGWGRLRRRPARLVSGGDWRGQGGAAATITFGPVPGQAISSWSADW